MASGSTNEQRGSADRRDAIPLLVASICASEVVLVFVNLVAGVVLHAIVLAVILSWQGLRPDRPEGRAVLQLALVPLLRLLSLTLPLPGLAPVYWTGLVGAALAVAGALAARSSGLGRRELGLTRVPWLPQLAIAASGLPIGLLMWSAGVAAPPIDETTSPTELILMASIMVVSVGLIEEFIFRGVVQAGLTLAYARGSILLGAILYGSVYLASLSFGYAVSMTLVGLVYGVLVERTGSIVGACASHSLLVLGWFFIWPRVLG